MVPSPPTPHEPQSPAWRFILACAAISFFIHLICIQAHGYFRDELYYLACANRLAWGYVDHPPLSVFVLKGFTTLLGTELWAVRLPGFLAHIAIVILYGLITAHLGGKKTAQTLACLFASLTPVFAVVTHLYSMNGLDIALWAAAVLAWLKASHPESRKLWLIVGLFCGLALLNKLSGLWLVAGLGLSTLASPRRIELKSYEPWLGILLAFIIFSPHFAWQQEHNWITQEFVRNATQFKMVPQPPWIILGVQVVVTNPILAIFWILGIYAGVKNPHWRPYVLTYVLVITVLLLSMRSRENYPAPAYIFVVPLGAIILSQSFKELKWTRPTFIATLIPSSIFCLCMALPILPPPLFEQIVSKSDVEVPAAERGKKSPLQGHADMFGWPAMAATAREIWLTLPDEERYRTPIFGMNYGESSAVWFFNQSEPNLQVIGRHNEFWLWGPGDWDGQTLIVIGELTPEIRNAFDSAEEVTRLNERYAVPEEATAPITILRGLKKTVPEFWADIRHIQ